MIGSGEDSDATGFEFFCLRPDATEITHLDEVEEGEPTFEPLSDHQLVVVQDQPQQAAEETKSDDGAVAAAQPKATPSRRLREFFVLGVMFWVAGLGLLFGYLPHSFDDDGALAVTVVDNSTMACSYTLEGLPRHFIDESRLALATVY